MGQKRSLKEMRRYFKWSKMKISVPKFMRCSKSSSKTEVHSDKCLPQETRTTTNIQPNFTPLETRKRTKEAQS